jgi:CheY-like chemotaxis protein
MNKSILILEENSVIHGLVGAALDIDGVTLHHEFNPDNYVDRARSLMPDLILISNADQASDYAVTRELKQDEPLAGVPLILLASSKETIDSDKLQELHVNGVVRKPFEASDLQQQVSRHLSVVDLIGSAFEYKQSQSIDEKPDPLSDLNVVDPEILALLHQSEGGEAGDVPVPEVDFSPMLEQDEGEVIDEEALAETLQPEAAFETVEEEPVHMERMDFDAAGEGGEEIVLGEPGAEEEDTIEELGAADLLEDESAEEPGLQPSEFDQSLEQEEVLQAPAAAEEPPLEEIEVEISADDAELSALGEELEHEELDLSLPGEEAEPAPEEAGEDIPLAVRRMMQLKPVLSMSEEEEEAAPPEGTAPEDISFVSGDERISVGEELGELDEIDLAPEPVFEDEPAAGVEPTAQGEEGEEEFREEFLGSDEIDEDRILQAMQEVDANIAGDEDEEELEALGAFESEEKEMDELVALAEAEAEVAPLEVGEDEAEELLLDQDEEAIMLSALEEEQTFEGAFGEPEAAEATFPEEAPPLESEAPAQPAPSGAEELDFELEESRVPPPEADEEEPSPADVDPKLQQLEAEAMGELEDLEESVSATQAASGMEETAFGEPGELEELEAPEVLPEAESPLLEEEPLSLEESEASLREAALEMGLEEPAVQPEPGLGADTTALRLEEEDTLPLPIEEEVPSLVDAMAAEEPGVGGEEEPAADYPDFGADAGEEEALELGEIGEELELDVAGEEADMAEELAQEDISEYVEDDFSEAEAAVLDAEEEEEDEFDSVFAELQAEIAANPEGEKLSDVLAKEGVKAAVSDLEYEVPSEETNLTRAMGISELPDETPQETVEGPAAEPPPAAESAPLAASLDLGGALLDEEIKAKLGAVLDEIITLSVRKAVQEEMPKLMEQMMKDDRPA